ncbi:uncharacterized protein EDB91DRAFT_1077379 [Suillus paluster]|uniref:uncharacterized protein n=1 Tax=Suillus paluster TaxID=48578 RepID=UPI001B865BD9|nr:uncharacterized protein EDB91DRAFT_1077379 [Suillus paluster]KAG1753653.1 hypothetical protein EDB91DRAFT_1077379 [Suillus paluster]
MPITFKGVFTNVAVTGDVLTCTDGDEVKLAPRVPGDHAQTWIVEFNGKPQATIKNERFGRYLGWDKKHIVTATYTSTPDLWTVKATLDNLNFRFQAVIDAEAFTLTDQNGKVILDKKESDEGKWVFSEPA